jgi:hypothetical protein
MSESRFDASVGWIGLRSDPLKEFGRWSFALGATMCIHLGFDENSVRGSAAKLLYCKLANVESSFAARRGMKSNDTTDREIYSRACIFPAAVLVTTAFLL